MKRESGYIGTLKLHKPGFQPQLNLDKLVLYEKNVTLPSLFHHCTSIPMLLKTKIQHAGILYNYELHVGHGFKINV